jgi:transcriptional regulator with XRE-family HTH domain
VRARLGISREELGDLLEVNVSQVGHVEAGRRRYSPTAQARLRRLAELVPAVPEAATPAPPAPGPTPAEATALRARLRACQHEAQPLREQQATWAAQDAALHQRRQGVAALGTALATPLPTPADPDVDPTRERAWLELLELATRRRARRQPSATARALLALRLRLLDEEAAALARLLAAAPEA